VRTFSSFLRRKVVTESGTTLGRCRDLQGVLTSSSLRVAGLHVGRYAWLEHLGIGIKRPSTVVPWDAVVKLEGKRIVVRDDYDGEEHTS
jgi:sporulation protein YlmC with PRC-barrel domain